MNFLLPSMLWGLLAAVPLLAVYFLRVRPRRRQVTAFFLWQKVLERKRASSLFQRLRDAFSLLLMLLVLLAAVLAAAGLRFQKSDSRDLVVLVDISPSMLARADPSKGAKGISILELARTRTDEYVKAMNGTRRMAIGTVSDELRFVSHLSDSPRDLLDALNLVSASDMPVTASAIASVNDCATRNTSRFRVILLTNGARGWDGLSEKVEVVRLGPGRMDNAGIIAADIAWSGSSGNRARFFYKVASSFAGEKRMELELKNEDDGTIARVIPLTLSNTKPISDTVDVEGARAGRWKAKLLGGDALAADDEVALGLPERTPVRVKIEVADNYFYKRCVEAFQTAGGALRLVDSNPDVSISKGSVPNAPLSVIFAPEGNSQFWQASTGPLDVLIAEPKLPGHPVIRSIDCDALRFEGAKKITPSDGSLVLIASESGAPLIWKSEAAGKTAIVINLDPGEGDFFLSPWFPVLVHNASTYLAGRGETPRAVYPTGTLANVPGGARKPDGKELIDTPLLVNQRGYWRDRLGNWFGGAIFSEEVTVLDGGGPANTAREVEHGHPPLIWLLWVALALLATEAMLYHRRKVG